MQAGLRVRRVSAAVERCGKAAADMRGAAEARSGAGRHSQHMDDDHRSRRPAKLRVRFLGGPWDGKEAWYVDVAPTATMRCGSGAYTPSSVDDRGLALYVFSTA